MAFFRALGFGKKEVRMWNRDLRQHLYASRLTLSLVSLAQTASMASVPIAEPTGSKSFVEMLCLVHPFVEPCVRFRPFIVLVYLFSDGIGFVHNCYNNMSYPSQDHSTCAGAIRS